MRCLIIDRMHESLMPMLEEAGIKPDYRPDIKREEILNIADRYEGMVVRSKTPLNEELISRAEKLKFIARAGAGLDQIDVEVVRKRNIYLVNAPEGNRDALAEHGVGMLLALFNNLLRADREVRNKVWDREGNRGIELMGKTIGLIGCGYMGQAFAKRLSGFGCKVLGYDKYKKGFSDDFVIEATLDELFRETDILSLHVPLTSETKAWINEEFLSKFKKAIFLLNTSRGEIVPLRALRAALESGKVKGAALDVLENEKLKTLTDRQIQDFEYLVASDQVIFSPHVAGWTHESYVKINETLVNKLKSIFFNG
ncbi:2-hydroxyacid dehydrogenase [Roseivirga sp. BDSF3-8]|uniref:2-hydroxyacid dehydrogenase n=1 Tax=Roseivirga sp. BDSF3-8 TaxID=3241598 RepID=UPI00353247B2